MGNRQATLTNSWLQRVNLLLTLLEFRAAFADVREEGCRGADHQDQRSVLPRQSLPALGGADHRAQRSVLPGQVLLRLQNITLMTVSPATIFNNVLSG